MNFDSYKNLLPYPSKEDFTTTYYYKAGVLVATKIGNEITRFDNDRYDLSSCTSEKIIDNVGRAAVLKEYTAEETRLYEAFQHDLFEDLGISSNPKRFKLLDLAWERGHSSGLQEVCAVAMDLVDLIE